MLKLILGTTFVLALTIAAHAQSGTVKTMFGRQCTTTGQQTSSGQVCQTNCNCGLRGA